MRRLSLMVMTLASLAAPISAWAAPAVCGAPTPPIFSDGVAVIKVVKVITGADGESHFEDTTLAGVTHPFLKTDKTATQAVFGPSSKVSVVSGPANQVIPVRPGGPAMFLGLAGASYITLLDGSEREIGPGVLAIFDDAASKSGHGGRTGPCGYVTLSIAPVTVAPASTH